MMKVKDAVTSIDLTENECKFLVNVLLDWDQTQKNQTKYEKTLWRHVIRSLDPYINETKIKSWRASD